MRVGEVDVAYEVQGDAGGDPIVLVHGTTGNRLTWMLQTPVLVPSFRVVLPEFTGSGETRDPGGPLEVDDLVAQISAVIDDVGAERVHLGGYSLGAVVAAALAAASPERVRSLALVCGWARTDAQMRFQFDLWQRLLATDPELFARYALTDGFTSSWFEMVGEGCEAVVGLAAAGLAPGSDRQSELDARVDIADRLSAITAPTIVIGGVHDRFVPVQHSRALADAIAGAELVEVDAGHTMPAEKGPELGALLLDFFTDH